jgi:hypothetical protein
VNWAARILIWLVALSTAFTAGMVSHARIAKAKADAANLKASEKARKDEHVNAVSTIRRMDDYSVTSARNAARALPARSDLASVQHSLSFIAAAPASAASGCVPDPRLSGIAELLGEGASLVEEGARHVDELRAKRDALKAQP